MGIFVSSEGHKAYLERQPKETGNVVGVNLFGGAGLSSSDGGILPTLLVQSRHPPELPWG